MDATRTNPLCHALLLLAVATTTGCGKPPSEEPPAATPSPGVARDTPRKVEPPAPAPTGSVAGTVTLDARPLDTGTVAFFPPEEGAKRSTVLATLKDGRYLIEKIPPGKYKVSVSSPRVVGKRQSYDTPGAKFEDVLKDAVPPRYNGKETTLLTATVEEGANTLNFELASR